MPSRRAELGAPSLPPAQRLAYQPRLVAIWHVLTERAADKHAEPQMVATKLMRWSWELSDEQRGGLTTCQFIRYHLMRLQLGEDLTHFRYGNMPRRVASVEELLKVKPELRTAG